MGLLRPATPGFLVTLIATVLLVVVVFCVPYFKSVYFLKAAFNSNGISGSITLGTLGYCYEVSGGKSSCSKASVGYEFDPNQLLGNNLPVQIPEVAVKWITYALVLHVVALVFAAVSAVFGLLAHVREMSMSCFSSCISGIGASICLIAFIFDLVFFFIVKSRINKVEGGSATIGTAVWLTLAAWLLLFFSGCFYGIGRCCLGGRGGSGGGRKHRGDDTENAGKMPPGAYANNSYNQNSYAETMRLDAVKAEADRKARAASVPREQGLPAFEEFERQPLRSEPQYLDEHDNLHYSDGPSGGSALGGAAAVGATAAAARRSPSGYSARGGPTRQPTGSSAHSGYQGGYASGTPGQRALDNYYNAPPVPSVPATYANNNNAYGSPTTAAAIPQASYGNGAAAAAIPGGGYAIGAVYRSPTGHGDQRQQQQQPYGDPYDQRQPQAAYADMYDPHPNQDAYDPYARHDTTIPLQHPTPGGGTAYLGAPTPSTYASAGYPTGHSYYTATETTPRPGSAPLDHPTSSYFPRNASDPYASPPPQNIASPEQYAGGAPLHVDPIYGAAAGTVIASAHSPGNGTPTRSQTGHYGPRDMPSPGASPSRGNTGGADWHALNASRSDEGHSHGGEALPEYNPYEPEATSSAFASGGPPLAGKR